MLRKRRFDLLVSGFNQFHELCFCWIRRTEMIEEEHFRDATAEGLGSGGEILDQVTLPLWMVVLRGSSGGKTSKRPTAGLKITEGLELESVQGCTLEKVFRVLNPSELRGNEMKLGRRKNAGFESERLAPVAVGSGATTVERSDRHSQLPEQESGVEVR